ncbi:uncharacterized protein J5F26_004308 isoform 1-T1 [Ciconia maguari]
MKGTLKIVNVFDLNKEFPSLPSQLKPAGTKERERRVDNVLHGEPQSCSVLPKSPYRIGIWKKKIFYSAGTSAFHSFQLQRHNMIVLYTFLWTVAGAQHFSSNWLGWEHKQDQMMKRFGLQEETVPSFRLASSFISAKESPAVRSRSTVSASRKKSYLLQSARAGAAAAEQDLPSAGDPNSLQSRGDAMARVSAAKAPREQSSTHRPDRVLRSLWSKTKQDSKQDLDYVSE